MRYFIALCAMICLMACASKRRETAVSPAGTYYTCSMHPQIMQAGPGKCPICSMELIPVQQSQEEGVNTVRLSDQQVQLGNIQTDTIGKAMIGMHTVLTATLNADETKSTSVNARIAGRIEKLYFKSTGEELHKGDKLYDLYSEELNAAKQEYLLAFQKQQMPDSSIIDFKQLAESARNKLLLWGMSEAQVKELSQTKKTSPVTTFYSPAGGTIKAIESHEGDYVAEGAALLRLSDLSTLWAEAQVYASQVSGIDPGGEATVQVPGTDGKTIEGKIEFINPEINPATRINLIRVTIPNSRREWQPGMPAYVILKNRPTRVLTLPTDAVIRSENSNMVWVQTAHSSYRGIVVQTGVEDNGRIAILSGLKAGDVVVTGGAYLINSEYVFKHGASPKALPL